MSTGGQDDRSQSESHSRASTIDLTDPVQYPPEGPSNDDKDPFRPPSDDECETSQEVVNKARISSSSTEESLSDKVLRKATSIALRREAKTKYKSRKQQQKFHCKYCDTFSNSSAARKEHINGRKHKAKVKQASEGPFKCSICDVSVRSNNEFERHISSKRHKKNSAKGL